ncbi:MAG TPA: hypothetical protein VHF25_04860 [Nitriliruptorales bacterium]|nr:hypothetical protein [Nitriliruptorales bacterium]
MAGRREVWIRVGMLLGASVVGLTITWSVLARRRGVAIGPDGVVDSMRTQRIGSIADRGKGGLAIDIELLRSTEGDVEPVVEYLTYIQSRRGVEEHLLFIRQEDIDAIAALEGQETDAFLERLQHLGVVISNN